MEVSRAQALAYRAAAHQLDRSARGVGSLRILRLGLQDSGGSARLSVDARLARSGDDPLAKADLALVWSLRGAPHLHRRADVDALAAALWPLSEKDLQTRLAATGQSIVKAGESPLAVFTAAVDALRGVVTKAMTKGAASTAVTKKVPDVITSACRTCQATHIADQVMRLASLPAGLELDPGTSPPTLRRRPKARRVRAVDTRAFNRLVRDYLSLNGPAGPAELAWFVGGRRADVEEHWPSGLTEVSVAGRRGWLPKADVAALRSATPDPELVRLLPPFDLYLQTSDRELLVPGKPRQKKVWPVLGRPGALVIAGDVAGVWRPKKSGAKLAVTIDAWGKVTKAQRELAESEAERMATVRASELSTVTWS